VLNGNKLFIAKSTYNITPVGNIHNYVFAKKILPHFAHISSCKITQKCHCSTINNLITAMALCQLFISDFPWRFFNALLL